MNVKSFFVTALQSALEIGLATCDDVIRHVTPDVLATHLPRPLWARLLTACVGAPRVDAQLVVDTIGVPNLCEHVPTPIIWACIEELAQRALGNQVPAKPAIVTRSDKPATGAKPGTTPAAGVPARAGTAPITGVATKPGTTPAAGVPTKPGTTPAAGVRPLSIASPPQPEAKPAPAAPSPKPGGPNIPAPTTAPLNDVLDELESESPQPSRARTPTNQRFRQTNTNIGRLAAQNNQRRPQAQAQPPAPINLDPATEPPRPRRGQTEGDFEIETDVSGGKDDWKNALAVEDEQLVDWSSSEETMTSTNGDPVGRKR